MKKKEWIVLSLVILLAFSVIFYNSSNVYLNPPPRSNQDIAIDLRTSSDVLQQVSEHVDGPGPISSNLVSFLEDSLLKLNNIYNELLETGDGGMRDEIRAEASGELARARLYLNGAINLLNKPDSKNNPNTLRIIKQYLTEASNALKTASNILERPA